MSESASTQIAVRIPNELLAWLRARAAKEHRSLASMIKALLEDAKGQQPDAAD